MRNKHGGVNINGHVETTAHKASWWVKGRYKTNREGIEHIIISYNMIDHFKLKDGEWVHMKLKTALELGYECGLVDVGDSILNIRMKKFL